MKHGKRPSRNQRQYLIRAGKNPLHWLVIKKLPDQLVIAHRETGTEAIINL